MSACVMRLTSLRPYYRWKIGCDVTSMRTHLAERAFTLLIQSSQAQTAHMACSMAACSQCIVLDRLGAYVASIDFVVFAIGGQSSCFLLSFFNCNSTGFSYCFLRYSRLLHGCIVCCSSHSSSSASSSTSFALDVSPTTIAVMMMTSMGRIAATSTSTAVCRSTGTHTC